MSDTEELKPCPFCGGKAHWSGPSHEPHVQCNSCQARTRAQNDAWATGGNWNRRVSPPPGVETEGVEAAERILRNCYGPGDRFIEDDAAKVARAYLKTVDAFAALKFSPYPAHGSGYVMQVSGDLDALRAALTAPQTAPVIIKASPSNPLPQDAGREHCDMPGCSGKGIKGNANIIAGKRVCDYCHAAGNYPDAGRELVEAKTSPLLYEVINRHRPAPNKGEG